MGIVRGSWWLANPLWYCVCTGVSACRGKNLEVQGLVWLAGISQQPMLSISLFPLFCGFFASVFSIDIPLYNSDSTPFLQGPMHGAHPFRFADRFPYVVSVSCACMLVAFASAPSIYCCQPLDWLVLNVTSSACLPFLAVWSPTRFSCFFVPSTPPPAHHSSPGDITV